MKVSILMPVKADTKQKYDWFRQAVDSILKQVACARYELIVVDDYGNIPPSPNYTRVAPDKHIGLAYTLNYGLKHCAGDLIIRMDADDIALPNLIQSHVNFFTEHPEVKICGCQLSAHDAVTWRRLDGCYWPTHHPYVVTPEWAYHEGGFWFCNHPGMAYRREFISKYEYREGEERGMEDYCLWIDILRSGELIFNNNQILIEYRYKEPEGRDQKLFRKALQIEKNKLKPKKVLNKEPTQ